ncbi:hypothetical protein MMC25_001180 [Agyrium rufum]|nr:hypothetical protein [Agyrium rufum]
MPPRGKKKAGSTPKQAGNRKTAWEDEDKLFSEKSKLLDINLTEYFANPEAWSVLDEEEKTHLRSLLPPHLELNEDGSIPQSFLRYDPDWRHALQLFQEDLGAGCYEKEWLAEAAQAVNEVANGDYDDWKEKEFEEFWGQKQKVKYDVVAGETAQIKLEELISAGMFKVGDVWTFVRSIGRGKEAVLIEKDCRITAVEDGQLTFLIPPGQSRFLTDQHMRPVEAETSPMIAAGTSNRIKGVISDEANPMSPINETYEKPMTIQGAKELGASATSSISDDLTDQAKLPQKRHSQDPLTLALSFGPPDKKVKLADTTDRPIVKLMEDARPTAQALFHDTVGNHPADTLHQAEANAPTGPVHEIAFAEGTKDGEADVDMEDRPGSSTTKGKGMVSNTIVVNTSIADGDTAADQDAATSEQALPESNDSTVKEPSTPKTAHYAATFLAPDISSAMSTPLSEFATPTTLGLLTAEPTQNSTSQRRSQRTRKSTHRDSLSQLPTPTKPAKNIAKSPKVFTPTTSSSIQLTTTSMGNNAQNIRAIYFTISTPRALETKLLEIDGRVKDAPAANAWKNTRLKRNEQDLGSLWEIREEYWVKMDSKKQEAKKESKRSKQEVEGDDGKGRGRTRAKAKAKVDVVEDSEVGDEDEGLQESDVDGDYQGDTRGSGKKKAGGRSLARGRGKGRGKRKG